MTRNSLRNVPTNVVLRMRGHALAELQVTPEHLYPLLRRSLELRVRIFNQELSDRASVETQRVLLAAVYDPEAPLERALRPLLRRRRR